MDDAKAIGKAYAMTQEVAKSIHAERAGLDDWESWGGYVLDADGQITGARADPDGNLILTIRFDDDAEHEHGAFELVLKPTDWRRVQPKKRKLRAKDVRANQRKKGKR